MKLWPPPHRTVEEYRGRRMAANNLQHARSDAQLDQAGHFVLVVDGAKKVELRRVTTSVELEHVPPELTR
jgi:hypothetical protein